MYKYIYIFSAFSMKQFDICNTSDKTYFTPHHPFADKLWKLLMTLCWQVREQLETPRGALLFIFILCLIKKKKTSVTEAAQIAKHSV